LYMWRWGLLCWLILIGGVALASDLLQEQKNAIEIKESLVKGKAISLKAGDQEFLAVHGEADIAEPKGAAILMHGMGGNPAWSPVVQPLRIGLPGNGWEILSLQMPVAPSGAASWAYDSLIPEAAPRIIAAIEFLKQRKIEKIVLVGHSMGARMGLEAIAANAPKEVIAFVAVGVPAKTEDPEAGVLGALQKIKLPILDMYGSRDLSSILISAKERLRAGRKAENSAYQQVEIQGADHFFRGLEDSLLARVRAWMGKQATQVRPEAEGKSEEDKQQKQGQ
jgi:pimeloyl-ACP methyl ester carboxylesterase